MSKGIAVPGAVYSIILAAGAFLVEYFTTGEGMGVPWAAIVIATVPILLKMITVQGSEPPAEPLSRGVSAQPTSKVNKFLLG